MVKHGGDAPWIHLTLAEGVEGAVVRTVSTNDVELVKQTLEQRGDGLSVRSFQAVFPCNFPDNQGIGVADIYELTERRTKKGMVFHHFITKFGVCRIGGPRNMMASEVLYNDDVVLYKAKQPKARYFGG